MSSKVKCTCGWSWNKSDSSKKDMYICHECGRDNSNNMRNGGWLDNYGEQENYNDYKVSAPEGMIGDGFSNVGRNYSPAWGGQFQEGGEIPNAQSGTRRDSLALYNNALDKIKFYKGNPNYEKVPKNTPISTNFKNSNIRKNLIKNNITNDIVNSNTINFIKENAKFVGKPFTAKENKKMKEQLGKKKFGKVPGTNLTSFADILDNKPDDIYNPVAPPIYLHPNISPQGSESYTSGRFGDDSDIPYYDPLAVKPFDLLTDAEKKLRVKKYGKTGVPKSYLNKPLVNPTKRNVEGLQPMSVGLQDIEQQINSSNVSIPVKGRVPQYFDITDTNNQRFGGGDTSYRVDNLSNLRELPKEQWDRKITPQYQMGGNIYPVNYVPQAQGGMAMPGSVGFTYARTQGAAPSKGPHRNQVDVTDASAQNGKEMQYYQEGLDFQPKTISQNGGWLNQYDVAQEGEELPSVRSLINDSMNRKMQAKSKGKEVRTFHKDNTKTTTPKIGKIATAKEKEQRAIKQNELARKQSEQQAAKDWVQNSMQEAYQHPLMSPGYFTPEGAAIGAMESALKVGPDLYEGNYGSAAINAIGALPAVAAFGPELRSIKTSIAPELRQGLRTAGPSFGSSVDDVTNISKNLEDLNYAKNWAKQYQYELPKNLERIAQSDELTNRTVRGMMNRHNTFVRGVSTNWDELAKRNPDILKNLEGRDINWKDNPEEAAKLMLTEIPPDTGYGRYMMNEGENALYTSNSIPTAQGYTYGNGYYAKLRRKNLDYSSNNRQDWINNNQLDYQKGINNPEGANIIKTDWQKRFPTSIEEFVKSAGNPNLLDDLMNKVNLKVKNKKSIIDKEWDKHLDVRKNIYNKAEEEMKKIYPDKTFHNDDYFDIRDSFITNADKKALDFTSKKIDKVRAFDPIKYEENQTIKEIFTTPEFYKSAFRNLIKPDKFGHYAFKGNPGEQIFDIVDLKKMTPELWQNKSRAHIGKYSKKLSALEEGGIIKDDRGQWDHPGEITEIGSNQITMQGVPYDVLGISDTGDTKLMKPGKNYKFKGKKVTEYPMAKNGLRQEQKGLVNLDDLTNFTNYNKPQSTGWLSKYE